MKDRTIALILFGLPICTALIMCFCVYVFAPSYETLPKNETKTEIVEPPKPKPKPSYYEITSEKIEDSGLQVIEADLSRSSGFSHSLTNVGFDNIESLIVMCKSKNVTVLLYYQGRLFGEGLLRHYDNWFFIEGETIYYHKYEFRFGW